VGGLTPDAAFPGGLEAVLRRDRAVVAASLVLVIVLAWFYLWRDAVSMGSMAMPGMADMPGMARASGVEAFALTFAMWSVMMVGMMLPGAAPTVLLYSTLVRKNGEQGKVLPGAWIFTGGYLAVWTGFSLFATVLQVALEQASLLTPGMASASKAMTAGILVAAGLYQWLPVKNACLNKCRNPLQFFIARWRPGTGGAFRMGAENGMYCVGCCWVLMLLLFAAGVMNLLWVALIAGFVFVEKLLPAGRFTARFAGTALVLFGAVMLAGR